MTTLQAINEFEHRAVAAHPGAGREAREDSDAICAMALIIVEVHRVLAKMHGGLGLGRELTDRNGITRQARYDIRLSAISQADYLADDLSPEGSAILYAEIDRILGDA